MAQWSAAVAAGAFVLLVTGGLLAIRSLLLRLAEVQKSAVAIQRDMHQLSAEIGAVLQTTHEAVRTVQRGLDSTDGLVQAVRQVGGTIEHTTSAVERVTSTLSGAAVKHAERIAQNRQVDEAVQWAELGLTAWQLWQTRRKDNSNTD
ncbi:DUF948 domain-containing protein [Paenibacillus sp. L3-i20]|uniref:DUF948 domain-containing protein n=1 Tax=Paenibacillus sp. L3-i20 TaxID=2905833 RepID=UPI001EE06DDF|nr:DUF948 domain-containing protein [Paenibacillus sp. L3-i20]